MVQKSLDILPTREEKKRDGTVQTGEDPQTASKMPTDPFTCRGKYSVTVNHMTRLAKIVICASKKTFLSFLKNYLCTLNKRNEVTSSCPYRNRFTLRNFRIT